MMIHKITAILLMSLAISLSGKAAPPPSGAADSSLLVSKIRITLTNNRIIRGNIISYDSNSVSIRTLTKKRGANQNLSHIEIIPYDQIQSLKRLGWGFYFLIIIAGTGLTALTILVTKGSNNLFAEPGFVLIGPVLVLAGLFGLFSKKKFRVNEEKESYLRFIRQLRKV